MTPKPVKGPGMRPLLTNTIRAGDVIMHEIPGRYLVSKLVAHLRAGGSLPPIHVDMTWREHWTQGPKGMESTGIGYGLLDGHHRLAAYIKVYGKDYMIDGVSYAPKEQLVPDGDAHQVLHSNKPQQAATFKDVTLSLQSKVDPSIALTVLGEEDKPQSEIASAEEFRRPRG